MTKSLADLLAEASSGAVDNRRTDRAEVCLKPELVDKARDLTVEHDRLLMDISLPAESKDDESDEEDGPPKRVGGEKRVEHPHLDRMEEIRDELAALNELMAEYIGVIVLRANLSDGEWRRWANEHPARTGEQPGHERDDRVTLGYCNADDLMDNLGLFVHEWNGEPLTAEAWDKVFEPAIGTADKADLALRVVSFYESRLGFQRLRSDLSSSLKRLHASSSPANSASATSDSTAGSPAESIAATTLPETA